MFDDIVNDMKNLFGDDQKRIDHALVVTSFAQQILQAQGGDEAVVMSAAILHDIGIHQAQKKYGSSAGKYQEIEGSAIARKILKKYDLDEHKIEHICKIIANHHSAKDIDTPEFRIVWDADWLVNIPDEFPNKSKKDLLPLIKKIFKTPTGLQLGLEIYIKETKK